MSAAHPVWLLAAAALAASFALVALHGLRAARRDALAYSDVAFFSAAVGARFDPGVALAAVGAAGILLLGLAPAGVRVRALLPVRGGAVVLCVDTSGSMRAADVAPSRAEAAAAAVRGFIDGVPADTRIGLVAFAGAAAVVQPLSDDKDVVREAVSQLPPPNGGTAIGDALAAAMRLLPASGRRAIVLVTDGVNNAGADPLAVAREVGARGVEIDTVGIGTNGSGELIPGTAQEAEIDEDALRAVAEAAHGAYARASDAAGLRARLAGLAASTTRQRRLVDLSLPLALSGGVLIAAALGTALVAGRFP